MLNTVLFQQLISKHIVANKQNTSEWMPAFMEQFIPTEDYRHIFESVNILITQLHKYNIL